MVSNLKTRVVLHECVFVVKQFGVMSCWPQNLISLPKQLICLVVLPQHLLFGFVCVELSLIPQTPTFWGPDLARAPDIVCNFAG